MTNSPPFAALNLRRNPFGELTRDEWTSAAVLDVERWVEPLSQPGFALQLLAPKGRGKTTHLLALAQRLGGSTYHRATRGPLPTGGDLLLLDEADSLWFWERRKAAHRWRSLAFSSHRDLSLEFRCWGFRVQTHRVSASSLTQLERIVDRRIALAEYTGSPAPRPEPYHLKSLHQRYGDNVRTIFDELYEHYQQLAREHVQM